jgi:hypothetical protein
MQTRVKYKTTETVNYRRYQNTLYSDNIISLTQAYLSLSLSLSLLETYYTHKHICARASTRAQPFTLLHVIKEQHVTGVSN